MLSGLKQTCAEGALRPVTSYYLALIKMIVRFSRNFELDTDINQFLSNRDEREAILNKTKTTIKKMNRLFACIC